MARFQKCHRCGVRVTSASRVYVGAVGAYICEKCSIELMRDEETQISLGKYHADWLSLEDAIRSVKGQDYNIGEEMGRINLGRCQAIWNWINKGVSQTGQGNGKSS